MENFTYYTPTKVVFGRGSQGQVGTLAKEQGATKVLVHYGSARVKTTGLLDEVEASLKSAGIGYVELGGVVPNPHLALVQEGIQLCRAEGIDFILAVGGGSVIDSAKAIGFGVPYKGDVWDFYAGTAAPTAARLPVGVVLTIAAAGSEMSNSTVITNTELGQKRGLNNDFGRCLFAVMNPELTLTLPADQTANGVVDIMMHTMERYFTGVKETMEVTDTLAEALLRTVMECGKTLTRDPQNYDARADLMWASSLSHNGLTGAGAGLGDWAPHQLGHELSARYDTAHGAALSALWGSWARYVYKEYPARFARFAVNVLELPEEGEEEELALAGIEELESFFWGLEMPTSFADLGLHLNAKEIDELVKGCSRDGTRTVGGFRVLGEADMEKIYEMANEAGK